MFTHRFDRLFYFLVVWVVSGCGQQTPQALLEDYLQRVANVLEQPPAISSPETRVSLVSLPTRRYRQLPITDLRSGLLDSIDLRLCGLLPLIAERNSSLGKVQPPSQRLIYELRFFARLQPCYRQNLQQPLLDARFSEQLQQIYQTKRINLQPSWWNALFTSNALERNLSLSRPPLPLHGNPGYGDSLRALQRLAALQPDGHSLENDWSLPDGLEQLEQHYAALYHSQYGSQLFRTLALLSDLLNRTAMTLDQSEKRRPLCLTGHPTNRAIHLKGVFDRYYGERLRPYLSQVYRQGRPWLESLNRLAIQSRPSEEFEQFRQQMLDTQYEQGLWRQFEQAVQRHTQSWQRLLGRCGMMPGQERG